MSELTILFIIASGIMAVVSIVVSLYSIYLSRKTEKIRRLYHVKPKRDKRKNDETDEAVLWVHQWVNDPHPRVFKDEEERRKVMTFLHYEDKSE